MDAKIKLLQRIYMMQQNMIKKDIEDKGGLKISGREGHLF